MKTKLLFSAAMVGLGCLVASPANAGVSFGFSIGLPVVVAPPVWAPPPRPVVSYPPPSWPYVYPGWRFAAPPGMVIGCPKPWVPAIPWCPPGRPAFPPYRGHAPAPHPHGGWR